MLLLSLVESVDPLKKRRMRVMPAGVQPIVDREAQVIQVELDERRLEIGCVAQLTSKLVSLKLEAPTEQSSQEAQYSIVRGEDVRSNYVKTNENGLTVVEAESFIERLVFEEQVEDEEHE